MLSAWSRGQKRGKRTKLLSLLMGRDAQDRLSLVAAFQQLAGMTVLG